MAWLLKSFNNLLLRFGVKVSRSAPSVEFFQSSPSCQIGNISELYEVFFSRRLNGVFVEVGAFDGYTFSNTWGLAKRGWRGIYVEPIPKYANQCRKNHAEHRDITVVEKIVSSQSGRKETLFLAGTLSTTSSDQIENYKLQPWSEKHVSTKQIVVDTISLNDLLEELKVTAGFDVLVVDVEGTEEFVFAGFDLSRWKPRMIIVELTEFHPSFRECRPKNAQLRYVIEEHGYSIVFKDEVNTVFVKQDLYLDFYKSGHQT